MFLDVISEFYIAYFCLYSLYKIYQCETRSIDGVNLVMCVFHSAFELEVDLLLKAIHQQYPLTCIYRQLLKSIIPSLSSLNFPEDAFAVFVRLHSFRDRLCCWKGAITKPLNITIFVWAGPKPVNLLHKSAWRCGFNFKYVYEFHTQLRVRYLKYASKYFPETSAGGSRWWQSTLVRVMACCDQTTCNDLNQCWASSPAPNGVTRPQCIHSDQQN